MTLKLISWRWGGPSTLVVKSVWGRRKKFRAAQRLAADKSGSAIVEYAVIAAPLLYLFMFLVELLIGSAAQVMLDAATDKASRNVFTGAAQKANLTTEMLKDSICADVAPIISCQEDRLTFELKVFDKFTDVTHTNPFDADGNFVARQVDFANSALSEADGDKVVLLRVYYRWPLITPFVGFFSRPNPEYLEEQRHRERILMATTVFRVEPFNVGTQQQGG